MSKLLFLGSGSAFTVGTDNYQSNLILESDRGSRRLLIDCGSDIRFSLYDAGFSYKDVTDIYISHLHADHVGGLEYIGISAMFDPHCPKPNLFTSKEIAVELWEKSLAGGMQAISGDIAELHDFFEVKAIGPQRSFTWEGITFELIKVTHVDAGYYVMPSYGLKFHINGQQIFFTTDTQLMWKFRPELYKDADIIFHDCEISQYPTTVHAHYAELSALPAEIKAKIWLYGYQPESLPDAHHDGFLGFVAKGQEFSF
ncbi:MAG: MBL fold metallo-hydrolase [Synechococcaceae cyanobacterium RL_1_2]|nr:MBL fold metallo-hydrolase [Synechococcaceae cyanobacterium RL_1_2]